MWKKIINRDFLFYFGLSFFIILLAQLPIFLHILHTPAGYYYPYLDQVSNSDFYYISIVRYGMGDEWLTKIPYITSEHKGSLIQIPFMLFGKLSLLTGIGPAEMIAIFRIIGGIVLLFGVIKFIKIVLQESLQKLSFILFLITEPLFLFTKSIFNQEYNSWVWHFGEATRRISTSPPHYLLGKGLSVLSLCFLFSYFKNYKKLYLISAFLFILVAGFVYPPPNFIILFSFGVSYLIFFAIKIIKKQDIKFTQLLGIGLYLLATIVPLVILKSELAKGYPWNMWSRVELGWNDPYLHIEIDYLRMFWMLFLLLPFSLKFSFKAFRNIEIFLFLLIWSISAFLLFPAANYLSVGKFRLTEGIQILPLSILGALTVSHILKRSKFLGLFGIFFVICYFAVASGFIFRESLLRLWPYWKNVYFSPHDLASFSFLNKNVMPGSIVLADDIGSNYLPAFSNVRTIYGFSDFYPRYFDYYQDYKDLLKLLKGEENESKALTLLKNSRADYVYFDKTSYGDRELYPNLLTSVFENEKIIIYKVKK